MENCIKVVGLWFIRFKDLRLDFRCVKGVFLGINNLEIYFRIRIRY